MYKEVYNLIAPVSCSCERCVLGVAELKGTQPVTSVLAPWCRLLQPPVRQIRQWNSGRFHFDGALVTVVPSTPVKGMRYAPISTEMSTGHCAFIPGHYDIATASRHLRCLESGYNAKVFKACLAVQLCGRSLPTMQVHSSFL